MKQRGEYEMIMEEDLKESINKHIELIKNLSSLSNVQLIAFVNILSVNNPEIFDTLKEVTKWESNVLSEFMKESEHADEKKKNELKNEPKKKPQKELKNEPKKKPQKELKNEPKKKPQKELKRASEDMFDKSEYDRVQIGGEQK